MKDRPTKQQQIKKVNHASKYIRRTPRHFHINKMRSSRFGTRNQPVVRKNGYRIQHHHASICYDYGSPDCSMCNIYPTLNVHRQVYIYKDNNCYRPQTSQAPYINCTLLVNVQRNIEENKTLPQGINHCEPKETQIVCLLSMTSTIEHRILE